MHIDCRRVDTGTIVRADVCIIGGGAAGITLAREFAGQPYRVCLLESGGLSQDAQTHALNAAINVGREYPVEATRLRYFGGSTNHWGGHCLPIRAQNFRERPWIPQSGWPLTRQDLDPYYRRAHEVLHLGDFDYDAPGIARRLNLALFPFDPNRLESVVGRYNPLRFGQEYRREIDEAANVSTYLFANVVSINRDPDGRFVKDVSVKTLTGKALSVRSKQYILAAGGIENARLLLLSNGVESRGLGNANDLVGRFFMDHIWYISGLLLPLDQKSSFPAYFRLHPYQGPGGIQFHVALPEDVIRRNEIPDYRAELIVTRTDRFHDSVVSAAAIRHDVADLEWPDHLLTNLWNVLKEPGPLFRRYWSGDQPLVYMLANHAEQIPNPESRISLAAERDVLGLNKAAVDWRLSALDKIGIRKAQGLIAQEVGRSGFGRMRIEMPDAEPVLLAGATGSAHHMGTTRMHANPHFGVVDANCRLHGLSNLFVAGSSIFPCCGYSNPTLTIVALAIRLADHINTTMGRRA